MLSDLRLFGMLAVLGTCGCTCGFGSRAITAPGVPPAQTVEGGIQVAIASSGLAKLDAASVVRIETAIESVSVCVPSSSFNSLGLVRACGGSTAG